MSLDLDRVVDRIRNLCYVVRLLCEGFEDQLLALYDGYSLGAVVFTAAPNAVKN